MHGYLAGPVSRRADRRAQRVSARSDGGLRARRAWRCCRWARRATTPIASRRDELYEFGKRLFEKGDYTAAGPHLAELLAKWNVEPNAYKESARMLLDIHLRTGPPAEIVRYFEIIKEKWPELELPFEKIVKVAAAYHEMGEYERSYLVFRATTESSFGRESAVGGFLEGQGEFLRSVAGDEPAAGRISAGALCRGRHVRLVATGVCQGAASGGGSEAAGEEDQSRRS